MVKYRVSDLTRLAGDSSGYTKLTKFPRKFLIDKIVQLIPEIWEIKKIVFRGVRFIHQFQEEKLEQKRKNSVVVVVVIR